MQFPRTGLVDVVRFGAWNASLAVGALICVATTSMWMVSTHAASPIWVTSGGLMLVLLTLACARSARSLRPLRLRWNDGLWRISFADGEDERSLSRVTVCIDLDAWMLLKCEVEGRPWVGSARWVALQRAGLQGDWHALRCALYAGQASDSPYSGDRLPSQ